MKQLLAIILALTALAAQSQGIREIKRTIQCSDFKTMAANLAHEYKEQVIWVGRVEENSTNVALLVNKETSTWTVIQYDGKTACVLSAGDGWALPALSPL
jgi:hypothetical protein